MAKDGKWYIEGFLKSLDLDIEALGLARTPERVAKMYEELFSGLKADPKGALGELFYSDNQGMVAVESIPYYSICEHHLTPFFGKVDIVYQPKDGLVAGLSKFHDLIKVFALRPQLQERLTANVADSIMEILEPEGVMVRMSAIQLCMMIKGDGAAVPKTYTLEARGRLAPGGDLHDMALSLLGNLGGNKGNEEII